MSYTVKRTNFHDTSLEASTLAEALLFARYQGFEATVWEGGTLHASRTTFGGLRLATAEARKTWNTLVKIGADVYMRESGGDLLTRVHVALGRRGIRVGLQAPAARLGLWG